MVYTFPSGPMCSDFNLDGTGHRELANVGQEILSLLVDEDLLFISYTTGSYDDMRIQSIQKETGEFIDLETYHNSSAPSAVAPTFRRMFGTTIGLSPADTLYYDYNTDGTLLPRRDGPYHGDHPVGSQHWVSPGQTLLVSDAGAMYHPNNLVFRKQIYPPTVYSQVRISDVIFYGEQPIILWDGRITAYDGALTARGEIIPDLAPDRIFLSGSDLLAFTDTEYGIVIETYPLNLLHLPSPTQAIDPLGLSYVPNSAFVGSGDILYLLSKQHNSIFRWSFTTRTYMPSITLSAVPKSITYTPVDNRIYLAYPGGRVTMIRLDISTTEQPFIVLPGEPTALIGCGETLFAAYTVNEGFNQTFFHATFSPSGANISTITGSYSQSWAWNEATRRLFYRRNFLSPSPLMWENVLEDGTFGSSFVGPVGAEYPILSVQADGTRVLISSGQMYNGDTFTALPGLPFFVVSATWAGDSLYSIRAYAGAARVERYNAANSVTGTRDIPGSPKFLLAYSGGLAAITDNSGKPRITLLDLNLNVTAAPPTAAFSGDPRSGDHPLEVQFTNLSTGATSYLWDFGDGQTSNAENPSHTYTSPGAYTVKLVASSSGGQDGRLDERFIVTNPWTVSFTTTSKISETPASITFTAITRGGSTTGYTWDFGDGQTGQGEQAAHVYTQPGSYTVSVTASGPGGQTIHTEPGYVTVTPFAAHFTASQDFGPAPLFVQFSNTTAGEEENDYLWTFGDGEISTERNPNHIYASRGTYTVSLDASGPYGTDTAEMEIRAGYGSYLPSVLLPVYTRPGHYDFNACQPFHLYAGGYDTGMMTECVTSIDVRSDGQIQANFSWRWQKNPYITECLIKYPDTTNTNMYLTDGAGLRYNHTDTGGYAENYVCMNSNQTYEGWFLFPPARSNRTVYSFHDDDNAIVLAPLSIPAGE